MPSISCWGCWPVRATACSSTRPPIRGRWRRSAAPASPSGAGPADRDGMGYRRLGGALRASRRHGWRSPSPDFHNPTGLTMRAADRAALALTCARAGTCSSPTRPAPSCASTARLCHRRWARGSWGGTVVTIGTMSKAAWGGLRDRLDPGDRAEVARARGAARQRRHDEPGPRPACRGRAAARLGCGPGLAPGAAAAPPRRAALRACRARPRLDGPPPPRRHQHLGAPPHARRDPPRRRGRRARASRSRRARRSRSTAPSSTTSACRSRCRPTTSARRIERLAQLATGARPRGGPATPGPALATAV